jgi:glycosyltransferase involved in cell wall biosynthesis
MKLLISTYACAPGRGSEHAVGWNWVTEAHRLGHQVWAFASSAHRAAIEAACRSDPALGGIHWTFPEVKGWRLTPGTEPRWERTYNLLWQMAALHHARALRSTIRFDAIHHLTWAGIRAPTFLGSLGAPLIIGPVGGGETSPRSLRDELGPRGRLLERIRDISNATITFNPLVRAGMKRAAVIFASTADTQRIFKGRMGEKIVVFSQLGLRGEPAVGAARSCNEAPRFLFAGRLLYWKAVHIAVRAFADVTKSIPNARFTIVGEGRERARLERDVRRLHIEDRVDFIPRLPQNELLALYESHGVLLFPSLHDSGGFVVLEALSHGMPVICLDLGGPRDVVTPESGIVIGTAGLNSGQVAAKMAAAIRELFAEPDRLSRLSAGAMARARQFNLPDRIVALYDRAAAFADGSSALAEDPRAQNSPEFGAKT